ncbi:anion permease [Desulfovibrio sp. OttesenSCG-928-G15]|nr:anion permease [Desulfovibrio sp. OttesenSCG-928-G15]
MPIENVSNDTPHEIETAEEQQEQQPNQKSTVIKILIALALGLIIIMIPRPETMPPEAHRLAAILVPVVFLWVSEAIPIGITALLATAAMIAFKVTSAQAGWAPYANRAVMFVMMIIMFGVVLNEVGLAKRMLFWILKFTGTNVIKLSFFISFSCTILATIFHDATVTIIMLFAILPIFASMGITAKNSTNLSKFFVILVPLASSAGGFGTLLGGGRCPLAVDITTKYILDTTGVEVHIGFLRYMMIEFPISFFTAVATWVVCYLVFRPTEKELPSSVKIEDMAPMSTAEKGVGTVFIVAFILWFMGDLTGLHITVVAALALFGFCAPGWVSFKTICDKFPWESWIVFGSGVSLGAAMLSTGLGKFLAESILPILEGQSQFVTYYGMGLFGSILSSIMSNSAAVALSLPITLPMASMMNMSVETVGLLAPMNTSFIMLVIGCPPTIIAYSTGFFSQIEFVKVAVPWCLTLLVICTLGALIYWPMLGV